MSEPYTKRYVMSADEAQITAKWQLGVRNMAQPLALALLGVIMLIEAARRLGGLPLPDWGFLLVDAAAVGIFIACLYTLDKRVKSCAASIAKRQLEITIAGDSLTITEAQSCVYRCDISGITRAEAGPNVVRITARSGAICIPRSALPKGFPAALRERLGKQSFKIYNWM